ncbi:unnamed protein product [Rotaria socialis]|uniref:Death domain-containing protein n=1 Tax=Rotaria socialis TaxID=392032 RepID=A0A817U9X6_9BILA|nr:unnamed protein product [Rotaria socialis]CAF4252617.1 unnamed protein product [Rotaria socialis]
MHPPKPWSKTIEPTSYEQIYRFVEQALDECSTFIDHAEADYYQGSVTSIIQSTKRPLSVIALQAWSQPLNQLREARLLHDIRNGKAIRELLSEASIGGLYGPVTDEGLALMKRVLDKTTEQLYATIPTLINKIADSMNLMEQYFLSFYEIDHIQDIIQNKRKEKLPDDYLETAYTYEKSRWLHIFDVNKSLKILREMPQRVEDTKGIALSTLSKESQELASRTDCTLLPYLFALPECYYEARRTLDSLRTWLDEDAKYNDFIQTSLKLLEEKYVEAKKAFEINKSQLSQVEHRAESYRSQLKKLENENEINEKKYDEFETRLNIKEREYISKRLTHEVYEEQVQKLLKQSHDEQDSIGHNLTVGRFQQDIKQLSRELPKLKSQVEAFQARINLFQKRKDELIEMRIESKKLDKEIQVVLEDKILKENYFNRIQRCRDIMRDIYKCRKTNDLPQKIFYDLPVHSKHSGENEEDELSKAFRLISKYIGRDWNRLYWQLPFYPTRGQEELSKDIQHVDEKYQRGDVFQDQAMEALNKWRRFHTRAKVDDLIHGLGQIRRFDIVQLIERRIIKHKHLLNMDQHEVDPRKNEIENLNRKLNRLFDKMRSGVITSRETYVYSTIGFDPMRPSTKLASVNGPNRIRPIRSISTNLEKSTDDHKNQE